MNDSSKCMTESGKSDPPTRIKESRWFKIRPTTANPSMVTPPILTRHGANGPTTTSDTDSPHLVAPLFYTHAHTHAHTQAHTSIASHPIVPIVPIVPSVCHVYICGTGCNPSESTTTTWWLSSTADKGVATIGLSYQWGPYSDLERNNLCLKKGGNNDATQDLLCKYHSDTIYGGNESGLVDVTPCNSIIGRLTSLLRFLIATRPAEEMWSTFMKPKEGVLNFFIPENEIAFEKFIFSGHSQGSGHVCYLSKKVNLARAILLSGPQEYLEHPLSGQSTPRHSEGHSDNGKTEKEKLESSGITGQTGNREEEITKLGLGASFLFSNPYCRPSSSGSKPYTLGSHPSLGSNILGSHSSGLKPHFYTARSWLDGTFATKDIRAFMHYNEENTSDLIRDNWFRIEPISSHYSRKYVDIEYSENDKNDKNNKISKSNPSSCMQGLFQMCDSCIQDSVGDDFGILDPIFPESSIDERRLQGFKSSIFVDENGESYRTFYSLLPPSAPWDLCGGRPYHVSTVSDRNTPLKLYRKSSLPLHLRKALQRSCSDYQQSEFISVPIYYMSIWAHLVDMTPTEKKNIDTHNREKVILSKL